jgi:hypothetical protein
MANNKDPYTPSSQPGLMLVWEDGGGGLFCIKSWNKESNKNYTVNYRNLLIRSFSRETIYYLLLGNSKKLPSLALYHVLRHEKNPSSLQNGRAEGGGGGRLASPPLCSLYLALQSQA